ncbi:uncharacterized protein DUF397 [Tamaricihabitans halophyticus]|uniref:Uncharacterized protein DUF397 n=1 Tax=Tamaricihabitans halophyticus TaxID=1262583 RepID=A0A4R2QSH8_9PSEU|nr:DUF397 domain-containing protein [Tamaricihabitans halophyticus]TCP51919.1 uncharacterized protein DUF397 [Tamaricihabitans halophyticus]
MSTMDLAGLRWRKSSYSNGGNNGACVEVAFGTAHWRKSSYSNGGSNGACVEVALTGPATAVRDSKHATGPVLVFGAHTWRNFLASV